MFLTPWVSQLPHQGRRLIQRLFYADVATHHPSLADLAVTPGQLPDWVRDAPVAMRYLQFLGSLDWDRVPERPCATPPQYAPLSYRAFLAACEMDCSRLGHTSGISVAKASWKCR